MRAAPAVAVGDLARAELEMNTDALGPEHRFDGCHLNARGRDAITEALVRVLTAGVEISEAAAR